jgi:hypothetical protein
MFDAMITNDYLRYVTFIMSLPVLFWLPKLFVIRNRVVSLHTAGLLGVGTLTAVFAGVIVSVFTYMLYAVIDPGLIDKTYAIMEEAIL